MSSFPTISATALRAAARHLAELLTPQQATLQTQPGCLFFAKRIHEMAPGLPETPDGLSLDYLELAAQLNNAALAKNRRPNLLESLCAELQREISRSVLTEKRLLKAVGERV